MKNRIIAIALASIVGLTGLTACSTGTEQDSTKATSKAQRAGQNETVEAFAQQRAAVPYPASQLKDSLERRNIKAKLLLENKPNLEGYVYIMSFGKFIGYYTIKGKVSSNSSQMTTDQLIVKYVCPGNCADTVGPINAPGDDGSYGPNEPGVFFFLTDGTMVKTSADYIYSTQPISAGNIPELNK